MQIRSRFLTLVGIRLVATISIYQHFGKVSDNLLYGYIANAKEVPVYSNVWSAVFSDDTLKSDQIHANTVGY